ncbi:DUF1275 family protein [Streptomyces sp. LARHCF252]
MSDASPALATDARRVAIMTVLTMPAGAVDAVSFLTMGEVFCALATGSVLFLSFALAGDGGAARHRDRRVHDRGGHRGRRTEAGPTRPPPAVLNCTSRHGNRG